MAGSRPHSAASPRANKSGAPVGLVRVGLLRVGLLRVGLLRVGLLRAGLLRAGLLRVGLLLVVLLVVRGAQAETGRQVIPPGRERPVAQLVQRALDQAKAPVLPSEYDIQVDRDRIRVRIRAQTSVDLELFPVGASERDDLAPGVRLACLHAPRAAGELPAPRVCTPEELARWRDLAIALADERDRSGAQIWQRVAGPPSAAPTTTTSAPWPLHVATLVGLAWLMLYAARAAAGYRRMSWKYTSAIIGLLVVLVLVALFGTAGMPLHEHNSYLARSDCAFSMTCQEDPAGPGWASVFFQSYGPWLRTFSYSVEGLSRFTLALSAATVLLAQHWLGLALSRAGFTAAETRRAQVWATALVCLNPLFIRVAISGTTWPYVMLCLFASGVACFEAHQAMKPWQRWLAAVASVCWFSLALNSNYVMLTLLPLIWLAPAGIRAQAGSQGPAVRQLQAWLPRKPELLATAPLLALSFPTLIEFHAALGRGAKAGVLEQAAYHPFFDPRLLPVGLGVLLIAGLVLCLRQRSPLVGCVYAAAAVHPTLTTYAGHPLSNTYPVGFINAYPAYVFGGLIAAVGATWLTPKLLPRAHAAWQALVLALLLVAPLPFAHEGWAFMRGSRVLERELRAISHALPRLPPHDQLLVAGIMQPLIPAPELNADPVSAFFPHGEYLAHFGARQAAPQNLTSVSDALPAERRVMLYVGTPLRSFVRTEIVRGVVPENLERPELTALRQAYDLTPVHTFELTPEQHPLISARLGADRAARVELGFYWVKPKAQAN